MAKYERFEDLPVWQEGVRLYNAVLDLLEIPGVPLSPGFRNQLDRAALSVSNNVAEGFERSTKAELLAFIAIARGSAGEVRSMMAAVMERAKLNPHSAELRGIRAMAESCCRQLTGWEGSIQRLPFDGPRHLPEKERRSREETKKADDFRLDFLRMLKPQHPLYHTPEARAARGEGGADGKGQMADGKAQSSDGHGARTGDGGHGADGKGQRADDDESRADGKGQRADGGAGK